MNFDLYLDRQIEEYFGSEDSEIDDEGDYFEEDE